MTTAADSDFAKLDASLAAILDPLQKQLGEIDEAIAEHEAQLLGLRENRKRVTRVLFAADPSTKPKPKNKASGAVYRRTAEMEDKLNAIREWMTDTDGDYPQGVTSEDVMKQVGVSRGSASGYLARMQEEGILRLDHIGGELKRTKFFKLAAARKESDGKT